MTQQTTNDEAQALRLLLEMQAQLMSQLAEQNKALGNLVKSRVALNDAANDVRGAKRETNAAVNDAKEVIGGVTDMVLVALVVLVTIGLMTKIWVAPTVSGWFDSLNPFHSKQQPKDKGAKLLGAAPPLVENGEIQLKPSSSKASLSVTSGFGMRNHPIHGTEKMHTGVDIALVSGTPLYMPVSSGRVSCLSDPTGYGTFADIEVGGGKIIRLGHLSDCKEGEFELGTQVASSGNSGGSTGAHLHLEVREVDKPVQPTLEYALGVLEGTDADTIATLTNRLYPAIVGQESGGNHQATNNASGATANGLTQIMSYNVAGWSGMALGYALTEESFREDAAKQEQISRYQMMQLINEQLKATNGDEQATLKRVASVWYSGNPDRVTDYTSIPGQPNSPPVGQYVDEVIKKIK
jgi:murein DD-endopeptidase MepM/ murein hydrolase activator NlpD